MCEIRLASVATTISDAAIERKAREKKEKDHQLLQRVYAMVERSKPTIAAQIHSVMDNGGKSCGITKFQLASENADVCFMSTTVRQAITDWLVPKGYSIGPYSDHQTLMVSWK